MFKAPNPLKQERGLNIIIVGCGKVGKTLVKQLIKEGHDITIIDTNPQKISELTNLYDIMGIVGNGASFSVQKDAGVEVADLLIAVTPTDELNLLCCTIAKQLANCDSIARVRTPDYSNEIDQIKDKLGLAMIINPEKQAALEMARILSLPTALEVNTFSHEDVDLVKFKIPGSNILVDKSIMDLTRIITNDILVCVVERGNEVYIPSGNFKLHKDDIISFVSSRRNAIQFLRNVGFDTNQVADTLIIGGGTDAYYLADQLIKRGVSVKIIESNRERCDELSILLPKAIIINGDGTDQELLKEEGIQKVESFVPLTGMDEENILLTMYARQVSKTKVITKLNRANFNSVINTLDLGSILYPQFVTSEAIFAYVRAKKNSIGSNIETLYHLFDSRVEAIEFSVSDDSKVIGTSLADMTLKQGILVACINRNGKVIIPSGQDEIMAGDNVIIVTKHSGFDNINDILQ